MEIFGFLFYFVLSTQKLPDLLCLEWETFLFLHHLFYKDKRHLAETFHMTSFGSEDFIVLLGQNYALRNGRIMVGKGLGCARICHGAILSLPANAR